MRIEDDLFEPTARERYERNYARIFKEVVERKWPVAVPDRLYPPGRHPNRIPPSSPEKK